MADDGDIIPESFLTGLDDVEEEEDASSAAASISSDEIDDGNDDASKVEQDMLESIFGPTVDDNGKDDDDDDDSDDDDRKPSASAAAAAEPKKQAAAANGSSGPKKSSTKALSLAPDVREAGRKARLRLEEERSKRKEIVRIEDKAEEELLVQKISSTDGKKKKGGIISAASSSRKRKRTATKSTRTGRTAKLKSPPTIFDDQEEEGGSSTRIDSWMPDTSSVSMEGRSNVVRVHGLPFGCKSEEVRRFFTGLSPVRVLMLVPYNHRIDGWDCSDSGAGAAEAAAMTSSDTTRKRRRGATPASTSASAPVGPFIKRYSSTFRVFVQLDSAPSAELALKRSGEAVFTTNATLLDDADEGDTASSTEEATKEKKKIGAAVFISPVPKAQASFLKKRQIAIDGVKGEPLHIPVDIVEKQLPRFVKRALWALAWSSLRINQQIQPDNDGDDNGDDDDDDDKDADARKVADAFAILEKRKDTSFPECPDTYRTLAIAYNSLCDLYDSIEQNSPLDMVMLPHDPTLLEDPICRLNDSALELISNEAERVDLVLRFARDYTIAAK